MNIWYLHHYATPDCMPGLHRPFEFGKFFLEEGHKLTVFTASFLHYSYENIISDKKLYEIKYYDGIQTVFVKTCDYSSNFKRVFNMYDFYKGVKKIARRKIKEIENPDIIIASSPHPLTMMAGNSLAKKFKVPCICEVRDFWPEVFFTSGKLREKSLIGKFLLLMEKKIYHKADALLFLKEGDYEYILERKWDVDNNGPINMEKCLYVNNGVDIELFDNRKEINIVNDKDLLSKKFKIVYCGAIRPINNVEVLVDVGKLLGDEYEILIYGTGNCVDSIKDKIKSQNITNVKLKGYIDNKYIPFILSNSSLNILNYSKTNYNWSRGNSSNKLFEYLASARPVVSTVKMGYDILERYNCGISSEGESAEEIACAIKKIKSLNDIEYQTMCKNARIASEYFDIKVLSKKYIEILNKVKFKEK